MTDLKRCDRCGYEGGLEEFENVCVDANDNKGEGLGNATFGVRYDASKPLSETVREKHMIIPGYVADLCLKCRLDLHDFFRNLTVAPRILL